MNEEPLIALQQGTNAKSAPPDSPAMGDAAARSSPQVPDVLSILPLRSFVVFPGTILPLTVGRAASIKLLDETLPQTKIIGLLTQRDETKEDPQPQDLYPVGTAAIVLKLLRQSDNHVVIVVQGLRRFALRKIIAAAPYLRAEVELLNSKLPPSTKEWEATFRNLRDSAAKLLELTPDLREQIKAIQRELGEEAGATDQIERLRKRLEEAKPPDDVLAQADRELKRLDVIPPASPEYSVIVSYVETIAELPWSKLSQDNLDLDQAQKILDRDHYDLEKVKRRLIEYLAVRKLNPQGHGPILCFLGPPGVGKTSLGQSIADALGRKFVRMSLGGIRDEAEIRGHRRTYIASMPGRIIQELRRA